MKPKFLVAIIIVLVSIPLSIAGYSIATRTNTRPPELHAQTAKASAEVRGVSTTVALTLGDGKISNTPKQGYIFPCQQSFNQNQAGAENAGDWIDGAVWYPGKKPSVAGNVSWKNAQVSVSTKSKTTTVQSNGLPTNHGTGVFPIAQTDPAYQYDRNPNSIKVQIENLAVPSNPTIAKNPTCVGMGMIGIATNGVAIFNGLDAGGRDAVAHELQDSCGGHPQQEGMYHYHGPSTCMPNASRKNALVGYALDGFGIFSMYDANGKELTNTDLDECHGRTSSVTWNGKKVRMYHYVLTREYPYTLGCFKGTPVKTQKSQTQQSNVPQGQQNNKQTQGGQSPQPGTMQGPPQEALAACSGKASNAPCNFTSPRGDTITGTCGAPQNAALACIPTGGPPQ